MFDVRFYGVRGSTPCCCPATHRVGGNTACVLVSIADELPIVFDLGTGLRYLGEDLKEDLGDSPFRGTALVTHLHWDHIQGLPFFTPILRDGSELTIVGPRQESGSLQEAFESVLKPPVFPVPLALLPGQMSFVETTADPIQIGSATISAIEVAHTGITNAYRLETATGSVAYVSDHQQPIDGSLDVPQDVADFCRGVDLLIHDAQYDAGEFEMKATWGHSTIAYAVEVAKAADVRRLVLFHHDPTHDDDWITSAHRRAQEIAGPELEVLVATEGLILRSGEPIPR